MQMGVTARLKRLLNPKASAARVLRGADEPVAKRLVAAMRREVPETAVPYLDRLENLRSDLLASDEILTWKRPWIATSPELQARMGYSAEDVDRPAELTVGQATKASRKPSDCRQLFAIATALKPRNVLEMGTNVGISGAAIASALDFSEQGRLLTLEGAPSKAELARANFTRLGLNRVEVVTGDFAETLTPALQRLEPLDLAFIDGFHEHAATVRYHHLCKSVAASGAVLIYDDIDWSSGMRAAWAQIAADRDCRFVLTVGNLGIVQLA